MNETFVTLVRDDGVLCRIPSRTRDNIPSILAFGVYLEIVSRAEGVTYDDLLRDYDSPSEITPQLKRLIELGYVQVSDPDSDHPVYVAKGTEVIA